MTLHSFHQFFYRRPRFNIWVEKIYWRKNRLPTPVFLGIPFGSAGKESTCNAGDLGSIPGLGRSPGEGNSYPLQYSGLENSMDCIIHGVTKSWTQLSHFHFHFLTHVKPQIYHIPHRGFLGSWATSTQTRMYVCECPIYVGLCCLSFYLLYWTGQDFYYQGEKEWLESLLFPVFKGSVQSSTIK